MFFSIKYKVFLAILLANVLLAVAMFGLSIWNFKRGFIEYLNQAEAEKLEPLSDALVKEYNAQQGWQHLKSEPRRWRELVGTHILMLKHRDHKKQLSMNELHKPGHQPDLPPPPSMLTFDPRILLLDEKEKVLFGPAREKRTAEYRPIVSGGKVIGYLGIVRRDNFTGDLEEVFVDRQQHSMALIMLVLLLLAGVIAWPLSMHLVQPVRQLLAATRNLIAGKFSTRIDVVQKDELGQLATDFNYLAKTLEENQSIRQQWIADVAHELRTPLAVLQGEVEAMQDGVRPLDKASLASLVQEIHQLGSLVNDLHDLSVSDLGGLAYKKYPVDIADIIETVVELSRHALQEKHIDVDLQLPELTVLADGQRLQQLFSNLMQNTLRYTDNHGRLEIAMSVEKNQAQIHWRDSAPGVDDAQLDKLFDRFYRVENRARNRQQGGSGLGLAICRNIVNAHNGSITAGHAALGGVEIIITLPVDG